MRLAPPRGVPIFWQTAILLIAGVIVVQCVSVITFLSMPPPRPDFNRLSDIAEALAGRRVERHMMHVERHWRFHDGHERGVRLDRPMQDRVLAIGLEKTVPAGDPDMVSDVRFSARLADQIGVPVDQVRLYFEPDQRGNMPFMPAGASRQVFVRRGEPIFFDTVIAAVRTPDGWRTVRTPPRDLIAPWQKRMLLLFALSSLAVIPFGWLFARRLTRPIRRIADAADRMGSNPNAPPIAEEGPAELRVTAHALNRMQERLSAYLAERTNMIGAIAHDLRTPLARIAFRIEGAPDQVREKVQADIEQMRAMIAATIGFVRDTGRIATVEAVALEPLLTRLIADERELGHKAAAGDLQPATIMGDRMALSRLFQNLIDNGVVYGGGVEITLSAFGDQAEIRIADRGPGLPAAMLETMFKPFERGDPSRNRTTGGIGLGLSIARAIAQEHGGTLVLAAREGDGLEAVCRLPLAAQ